MFLSFSRYALFLCFVELLKRSDALGTTLRHHYSLFFGVTTSASTSCGMWVE